MCKLTEREGRLMQHTFRHPGLANLTLEIRGRSQLEYDKQTEDVIWK